MSGNRLFLTCSAHPSIEDSLCIADRMGADEVGKGRYYCSGNCRCIKCQCANKYRDQVNSFLAKHADCGVDNFALAYHRPKAYDVSPPAQDTPAGAVRLALAAGMEPGNDPAKFIHGDEQSVEQWQGINGSSETH